MFVYQKAYQHLVQFRLKITFVNFQLAHTNSAVYFVPKTRFKCEV